MSALPGDVPKKPEPVWIFRDDEIIATGAMTHTGSVIVQANSDAESNDGEDRVPSFAVYRAPDEAEAATGGKVTFLTGGDEQ